MKTAYSYIRFSSGEQKQGDSLRRQLEGTKAFCQRHGLTLQEQNFQDLGVSGFTGKHRQHKGQLKSFLDAVSSGKIKTPCTLVIENPDRLTREQPSKILPLISSLLESGVIVGCYSPYDLFISNEEIDKNPQALQMFWQSLFVAHMQSKTKSERVSQSWASKRTRAGQVQLTEQVPLWLNPDRSIKPEESKIIQRIFSLALEGMGGCSIAQKLNKEGVQPFQQKGNRLQSRHWHQSYITGVLRNKAVIGIFQPKKRTEGKREAIGEEINNYYPAIISEEIFYKVQNALNTRRTTKSKGRTSNAKNLFSGLIWSVEDNCPVYLISDSRGSQFLVSKNKLAGLGTSKNGDYRKIEFAILRWLQELDPTELGEQFNPDTSAIETAISKATENVDKVKARLRKGFSDELADILAGYEGDRQALQIALEDAKAEQPAQQTLKDIFALISDLGAIETRLKVRDKLRQIIRRIWFHSQDNGSYVRIDLIGGQERTIILTGTREHVCIDAETEGLIVEARIKAG